MSASTLLVNLFAVILALTCVSFHVCASRSLFGTSTSNTGHKFQLGNCPAAVFYAKERACIEAFYKSVRINRITTSNCSLRYGELRKCVVGAYQGCTQGSVSARFFLKDDTAINNFLTFFGDEHRWCSEGGLSVPSHVPVGTVCHPIYRYTTKDCVAKYQMVFNSRASLSRLCREHQQAKTCLLRNLITHCSFNPRPLRQMIEEMVSAQFRYQPFCTRSLPKRMHTYGDLQKQQTCPPQAHTDVTFVLDVSGQTSDVEFQSMKNLIANVTKKLNYGGSGIRASMIQFHERSFVSIRMNRYSTRKSFLRGLNKTKRMYSRPNSQRLTGKTLSALSKQQLSLGETSSVIRPHHSPVVVVLTTGVSKDSLQSAVQDLKSKRVQLIRLGPSLRYGDAMFDFTYHVADTTDFSRHSDVVLSKICDADSEYRNPGLHPRSPISEFIPKIRIQPRLQMNHLPLLWVPTPLPYVPFTTTPSIPTPEPSYHGFPSYFDNDLFPSSYRSEDDSFYNIGEGFW